MNETLSQPGADGILRPHGVPQFAAPSKALLREALRRGWRDFRTAPALGLFFGAVYAAIGLGLSYVTIVTGQSFWLVLAVIGFPLVGPFAAVGLYEVSHRLETRQPLDLTEIFGVIWRQRSRQLPWICAIIVILFLFWFFVGHMIFALFLGLSAMTNVSSGIDIYLTREGLAMLAMGTLVGAGFALLLYSFSVIALPMLLDREVDFVTAMLTSIGVVQGAPLVMIGWAVAIAVLIFLALAPAFLGLLVIFPWLAHASWHVYALMRDGGVQASSG